MQKKWIYYGLAALMAVTLLTIVVWKNNGRPKPQTNDDAIAAALVKKVDALFYDDKQIFLRADLTAEDISAVQNELERILIGKNLTGEKLAQTGSKADVWQTATQRLETIHKTFLIQEQTNKLFLAEDYRNLTDKAQQASKTALAPDELFEEKTNTTSSSQTDSSQTATSSTQKQPKDPKKADKNVAVLSAINGRQVNQFLVIDDMATREAFTTLKKALEAETKPTDWHKAIQAILTNGLEQVETIETAEKMVAELFDGETVKEDISKDQYKEAMETVENIYNTRRQQVLMDKMEKVAKAIGEEFSNKDYLFEELSDRSAITLEATQTNSDWWQNPITFSIKITNKSERNISFAYSRFGIQKPNKTINKPDFAKSTLDERFIVKKGEAFTIKEVPFKYPNETIVKSSKNSHLVYLLDNEVVADPKVLQLLSVTFTDKAPDPSTSKTEVSSARLATVRKMLVDIKIDDKLLSDSELEALVLQATNNKLTETGLLMLICDHLGLDYQTVINDANKKEEDTSSATSADAPDN